MIGSRRGGRDDEGSTLVEFALVMPVLILVLVVCLDFARALNAYVTIANASREAARYAIVHPEADLAAIRNAMATRVAPLDPARLDVVVTYNLLAGCAVPSPSSCCGSTASPRPQPWPAGGIPASSPGPVPVVVCVDATYGWSAATWLVGSFFGASGSQTFGAPSAMVTIR